MAYPRKFSLMLGVAIAVAASSAKAADLPVPAPMPAEYGGWYLRGDIGFSNQKVDHLASPAPGFGSAPVVSKGFDSGGIVDVGVGYKFNSWLRADITGEYRMPTSFDGFQIYPTGTDQYNGKKSEWLFLANLYLDLGTWYGFTPFIGGGVGFDRLTIGDWVDTNVVTGAAGYSPDNSKWNFAWALYAGFGYQLTPNCTLEFSYRYLSLGNGSTKDMIGYDGTNPVYNPIEFRNVYSNDVRIGLRWMFADGWGPAPEPLMRY